MQHSAFNEIYEQHVDALFTHAYFRVSNRDVAKDLVQETFIKAWRQVDGGGADTKPIENWKAFLYTILNNRIIDHYRTKKGKDISLDMLEEGGESGDGGSRGEFGGRVPEGLTVGGLDVEAERFDTVVTSSLVRDAVAQLAEPDRTLVTMRFLGDEPTGVVAEVLGMTENAVYVRSHRALAKLKKLLESSTIS